MKTRTIIVLVVILAAAALVTWLARGPEESSAVSTLSAAGPSKAVAVNAQIVEPQAFTEAITLTGTILANEAVMIRPEVAGRIVGIRFREGQRVEKGQVLATLFDADLQASLRQVLSQVVLDSESVQRLERIRKVDGISIEELQRAQALLEMHRAEADVIRAQIEKTVMVAPFHGLIGLRNVSEGAVVTPQTDIALLKDDSKLKLECTVPEKYAVQIAIGTQMSFQVRGGKSDRRYVATVYAMDPELDPMSRTLRLRATIQESAGLIPGMFADVDLTLSEIPDALLVPTEAVVVDIKGPKVFVKRGAQAQEIRITSGTRTRRNVLVVRGLAAGDTVLTTGMLIMKDGMPVSVSIVAQANEDMP